MCDSDLQHPTSDVRQRFFRSGTEKIGWQVTLDECRQNNGKVETKFAVANRPSDVVSRIHVYADLVGISLRAHLVKCGPLELDIVGLSPLETWSCDIYNQYNQTE